MTVLPSRSVSLLALDAAVLGGIFELLRCLDFIYCSCKSALKLPCAIADSYVEVYPLLCVAFL